MERQIFNVDPEVPQPVLLLLKTNITLATTCEMTDNFIIDLIIKTPDTDGNEISLYSGPCNIRFIDSDTKQTQSKCAPCAADIDHIQMEEGKEQSSYPPYSQSQIWIDPERSPLVYNGYKAPEPQARWFVYPQVYDCHVTPEQHHSPAEDFEHQMSREIQADDANPQSSSSDFDNLYVDEYECGEFFSQLPEEIITEKEARAIEEMQLQSVNDALKPSMSLDTQSTENTPHFGQTKISVKDPSLECAARGKVDQEVIDSEIRKADSEIARVLSNKLFLKDTKTVRARYRKVCDICFKYFDRIRDFKRHLIEHVIRSTLAKNPVNKNGILNILCEVCKTEGFSQIDEYKAHLRVHAKLTTYECKYCNKSFSDSSNFSKHKKIHGATYFQCDLCQRKFNSKKRLIQHMEYHDNNSPISCSHCKETFYFESTLNKHVKSAHSKQVSPRFRCKFCHEYFRALKDKWDHEWIVHNARKIVFDCPICVTKFRTFFELKRHCNHSHDLTLPPIKKFLKKHNTK